MNRWRGRLPQLGAFAAVLALGALLLASPQRAAEGFGYGVQLCLHRVLPALFPFFVVCDLLASSPAAAWLSAPLRPVLRRCGFPEPCAPLALTLSWLGGYAACAATLASLRRSGQLSGQSARRLLLVGFCAGPGFVVGSLGGLMLGSVRLGVLLYGLQLAANLLSAACLLPWQKAAAEREPVQAPTKGMDLSAAISGAVDSALQVCGCTVFFCAVNAVLCAWLPGGVLAGQLLGAMLEVSAGCAAFTALGGHAALYGVCFCLSVAGLSVFCQVRALFGPDAPLALLALSRLLHALWLQLLVRVCARWMPGVLPAYSSLPARVIGMSRLPPDAAILCFIFLCCTLYKLGQTFYNRGGSAH